MQWSVMGDRLPADHCYRLYSALIERQPSLKDCDWQLGTINGIPDRNGWIKLGKESKMMIRCDLTNFHLLDLGEQIIRVGQSFLQFRDGEGRSLQPLTSLQSRLVTIKSEYRCRVSPFEFGVAIGKKLAGAGFETMPLLGERKTLRIKNTTVVGYSVRFEGLKPHESLYLQRYGLGGRRKMGCGVFE